MTKPSALVSLELGAEGIAFDLRNFRASSKAAFASCPEGNTVAKRLGGALWSVAISKAQLGVAQVGEASSARL